MRNINHGEKVTEEIEIWIRFTDGVVKVFNADSYKTHVEYLHIIGSRKESTFVQLANVSYYTVMEYKNKQICGKCRFFVDGCTNSSCNRFALYERFVPRNFTLEGI
jgi:hypothetical protein